jgi:hypothetical protein
MIAGAVGPLAGAASATAATGLTCPGGSDNLCIPAQGANEAVTGTAGSVVRAGYDFTVPGPDTTTVIVSNAFEQLTISCANGKTPTVSSIMVPMPTVTYTAPFQQSNGWVPSGDQSSPLTYEGSFTLGDYCSGGTIDVGQPGQMLFAAQVQSNGTSSLSFRSHYNDAALSKSGSWSATVSVKPTPMTQTPPALVQTTHNVLGEVSSISAQLAQPTAGDVLIVEVGVSECVSPTTSGTCNNPTTESVTDSAGNTFTEVKTIKAPDGAEESIWTAPVVSVGSGTDTATATPTGTADMGLDVVEYSGLTGSIAGSGVGSGTTTGSAGTASSAAASAAAGDLVLGFEMDSGWQTTVSPGGGFTAVDQSGPNGNSEFLAESQIASTTSVAASAGLSSSLSFPFSGMAINGSTFTVNGVPWAMVTIAFAHS